MKSWVVMTLGTVQLLAEEAQAAISGQIGARRIIIASCEVTHDTLNSSDSPINDFGLLDFGARSPTWINPINATLNHDLALSSRIPARFRQGSIPTP